MDKLRSLKDQPCCGYFLQGGVRAVAILDIGISLFAMILIGSEFVRKFAQWTELRNDEAQRNLYYIRGVLWASYFAIKIVIICLSIFLFKTARRRNARMCKLWIILSSVVNLFLISAALATQILFGISTFILMFLSVYILYKLYCIHVVYTFITEIRSYGGFNACLSGLTDAEVEEFEKGNPPDLGDVKEVKNQLQAVRKQAFNKDFEVLIEDLDIDFNTPLGAGAFGTVYRAKLTSNPKNIEVKGHVTADMAALKGSRTVAVKTVNDNTDPAYFKTLLGELKIMTFLPPHPNVVNLIGACTSHIREKQLYIVVEFCPFGNLHDFLRARRGLFVNYVKDGEHTKSFPVDMYTNINVTNSVTTFNLIRWSYETSKGMEFLEDNKVIHGDLAARNLLLGYDRSIKITDFGLSKKLYQYMNYVKKEDKLLPWRWMSIESLRDMTFCSKSDTWAYGVTLWEIFSLAEVPYPGFSWNFDFITKIMDGLRMNKPAYATNDIYELMLNSWHLEEDRRPCFREIREFFEQRYDLHKEQAILNEDVDILDKGASSDPGQPGDINEVEVYIGLGQLESQEKSEPLI